MKNVSFKWLVLVTTCCIGVLFLMGATRDPQQQMVENLLKTRADVMENVLFGKITYEEGKQQLKEVEADALYKKDLESLQQYQATDLDRVKDVKILSFAQTGDLCGIKTFAAELQWTCEGYEGVYSQIDQYQLGIKEMKGEFRLISMERQEE